MTHAISSLAAESPNAALGTNRPGNGRTSRDHLESVFSEILTSMGQQGIASAQPLDTGMDLQTEAESSWRQWFDEIGSKTYSFVASAENPSVRPNHSSDSLKEDFGAILRSAYSRGGYAAPQSYLQSMSAEELATIQQVQHLADPIRTTDLSPEAALNLLLPPAVQVDANHDGLTACGAAFTLRFPNSNTPKNVRTAWDQATEHLSESDRATYELQMCMPIVLANMRISDGGNSVRMTQPGDADWLNPMSADNYSYEDTADSWIRYLRDFQYQIPADQFQHDLAFWSSFRNYLRTQ